MFIESPSTESEQQFRDYVTELVTSIYGRSPEWFEFRVGRRVERRGFFYRELVCPAGSVWCQISMRARHPSGISRAIILQGQVRDVAAQVNEAVVRSQGAADQLARGLGVERVAVAPLEAAQVAGQGLVVPGLVAEPGLHIGIDLTSTGVFRKSPAAEE